MNDRGDECPFRRHSRETLETAMDLIASRVEKGGSPVAGIPTGLIDLDDVTGGLQPGQLIVVGGRPSMGKTALALDMCAHAAFEVGAHVLYFSLELARHEVGERLLCARSGIDGYRLRTGMGLGGGAMAALAKAFNGMSRAKGWLYVDDTPGRNALQVAEQARKIKGEYPVGLVAIDYVSLLGDDDAREGQEERIASASRQFKTLARELNVPILAVSQLGRAVERREDRRPRMSDLGGSGAIEEDADVVLLLFRPDYYDANDQPGIAELIVAKNRNGRTETVKLTFQKSLTRFENLATAAEPLDEGSPF